MISEKTLDALKAVFVTAKQNAYDYSDDENRLKVSGLFEDWQEGKHTIDEIYNANGQTWECFQAYDNAIYPDINPDNAAWYTFNRPLHGKSMATAREFIKPMGAHDMYKVGEYMIYNGIIYKCIIDTVYSPNEYKAAWEAMS